MRTPAQQKRYEYKKAWAQANAEKMRESRKLYEIRNIEKIAAYRASEEFKVFTRKNTSNYQKRNKGKVTHWARQRQLRKLQAMPLWANSIKIEAMYSLAAMLTKKTSEKWHVDHVIPLKNQFVCGLHVYENLQVISAKENFIKSNKFDV
jgi:hypothetical protein